MAQHLRTGCRALLVSAFSVASASAGTLSTDGFGQPLRFFEGRTEMISVIKVVMKKPYRSHTTGSGRILSDGSLALLQLVQDDGKPTRQRQWRIRQIDADQFVGTMSDAIGPVQIRKISGQYRFSFKLKGNLAVEQWLTPAGDGRSARSRTTVRKFGMRVASSEGTIRKL